MLHTKENEENKREKDEMVRACFRCSNSRVLKRSRARAVFVGPWATGPVGRTYMYACTFHESANVHRRFFSSFFLLLSIILVFFLVISLRSIYKYIIRSTEALQFVPRNPYSQHVSFLIWTGPHSLRKSHRLQLFSRVFLLLRYVPPSVRTTLVYCRFFRSFRSSCEESSAPLHESTFPDSRHFARETWDKCCHI